MADEEDGEPSMNAECRVEALPLSGADITVDGLRLRLDIRIVPRAKGDAAGEDAMFRVVTAKISRATQLPAYQWAAAMVGIGTLLIAITVWVAGIGEAPSAPARSAASELAPYAPPLATKAAPPAPPAEAPRAVAPPPSLPAPAEAPTPAAAQAPASPPARVQPLEAAPPPRRPERPSRVVPAAARAAVAAASPAPSSADAIRQPVAQRPAARDDMLDLFGDTK